MFKQTILAAIAASLATAAFAADFALTSPDLADGKELGQDHIANAFGCSGPNISPALAWTNAPDGTKSFVVSLYDPDAPTGSGFWHWVMFDIPASTEALPAGITPDKGVPQGAIQSKADAGHAGYLGACPPAGETHRYVFSVTALDTDTLGLDATASGALIGFMTNAHALARSTITVTYGR